jgi:hypothetical protein
VGFVGREVPIGLASSPEVLPGGRTSRVPATPNDMNVQTLLKQQQRLHDHIVAPWLGRVWPGCVAAAGGASR